MSSIYASSTEDVKKRLRPFGIFFEKSLKDLIKGIRSNNETPEHLHDFLDQAISECREEVKSPDFIMKTNAVLKLTYLEMYGFDMSWANFHVLEVMSSSKFQQKRVGYLAASQSFYKDTDILMLATNLLKKDLKYDLHNDTVKMGIALSGLSTIVTPELARDICDDLFLMLNSGKPYIRKKAVTALFKVFLQYPESLRDGLEKFVARLEDEDTSVVSATVSVICELAKHNPQPFIQFSPLLYEMLIQIDNNWIIIRLLKLFSNLSKVEPKLRYKILPKVLELMDKTTAISVIYESINCIVKGQMLEYDDYDTAAQCLTHLESFVVSADPNLRYISCVLFYHIGKINFKFIKKFDKLVISLLKDVDISIRTKVLELCSGITTSKNIRNVVKMLVKQFVDIDTIQVNDQGIEIDIPSAYKVKVARTILAICSSNNYENIDGDFEWLIKILSDLCIVSQDLNEKDLGYLLGDHFRNIMVKVPSMRETTLEQLIQLTTNYDFISKIPGVLKEGIWCFGEYSELIDNCDDLIKLLLSKSNDLPEDITQVTIVALVKLFSTYINTSDDSTEDIMSLLDSVIAFMEANYTSTNFEIQERSVEFFEMLKLCRDALNSNTNKKELPLLVTDVLPSLFNGYELGPILQGQQKQLLNSLSVDFETPFFSPTEISDLLQGEEYNDQESELFTDNEDENIYSNTSDSEFETNKAKETYLMTEEEAAATEERKRQDRLDNPFYLDTDEGKQDGKLIDLSEKEEQEKFVEPLIKISKNKKKTRSKSVQVLSDIVVAPAISELQTPAIKKSDESISLSVSNNLKSFDFSKPKEETKDEYTVGQEELDRLRDKLSKQKIGAPELPLEDENDEIIVIKKKKTKSKESKDKEKSHAKKKKKKKKVLLYVPSSSELNAET